MWREIRKEAERLGLQVEIWSPGDGATRYQFLTQDMHEIITTVGAAMARVFLRGYEAGLSARRECEAEEGDGR
jgi:hypothetical protein